ncbi:MAG TPA: type IV pili methyl-accepting chemotaxis transducer N-terminal domain-containing protein [Thauera sp.]|nr:type IV pili methyl-accepting chemotaxis transducer N-terminal domain-containing protein [Thauera sp.]
MIAPTRNAHRAQRELIVAQPLFAGLPLALVNDLVEGSRVLELPAQELLYCAEEPIREAFVLVSGSAMRTHLLPSGNEKVLELAQAPQVLGLGELLGVSHYGASCRIMTPSVVVAIDILRWHEAVQRNRELSWRIIQALAQRQYAIEFDVTGHHSRATGAQRILDYLLEQAGEHIGLAGETTVVLRASKKIIAARIGMTPESFSRSLRQLSEQGLVVVEGRKVHVQHAALLDTETGTSSQRLRFARKAKAQRQGAVRSVAPGAVINLCGRFRLLSQRMAVAWALIALGVSAEKAAVRLRRLEAELKRALLGLAQLELPDDLEAERQTLVEAWPDFLAAVAVEGASSERGEWVFVASEKLLEAADRMTTAAEQLFALPDAHYVNVAGRNRMLSQRIAKLFLLRGWVAQPECIRGEIEAAIQEFECNLDELRLSGRSLPELSAQLQEVSAQWEKFLRALAPDTSRTQHWQHARSVVSEADRLLRHVDTAVKLYERLTPASGLPGTDTEGAVV